MGLNFQGLGFGFSAKDEGLLAFQRRADRGFSTMAGTLESLTFMASRFTNEGMNLTTELEKFRITADTNARRIIANSGFLGKDMDKLRRKAVGLAEGLNRPASEMARAVVSFERMGSVTEKLGIQQKDLAKFLDVTGATGEEFADITDRLRKEMNLSDDQTAQFIQTMVRTGEATRDIGRSITFTGDVLKLMSRAAAAGEHDLKAFGESTLKLSAGLFKMVGNAKSAQQTTRAITEALVESREGMLQLLSGTKKDIPGFVRELAIAEQDVSKAFNRMQQGPAEFIEGIVEMTAQSMGKGRSLDQILAFMEGRFLEVMDPAAVAQLINMIRKVGAQGPEALLQFKKALEGTSGSIKKINDDGFRTGRSAAEWLDLYEKQLVVRFRQIAGDNGKLVSKIGKGMRHVGDVMERVSRSDGPMGAFVRKMSEAHSIGALALLPETLRPMASAFSSMVRPITEATSRMGAFLAELFTIEGASSLVVGGLTTVAMMIENNAQIFRDENKGLGDAALSQAEIQRLAVERTGDQIVAGLGNIIDQIEGFVDAAPTFFDGVGTLIERVDEVITTSAMRLWPKIQPLLMKVKDGIVGFAGDVVEGFKNGWDPLSNPTAASGIGVVLGRLIGSGFSSMVDMAKKWLPPLIEKFVDVMIDSIAVVMARNKTAALILTTLFGLKEGGLFGAGAGAAAALYLMDRGKDVIAKQGLEEAAASTQRHASKWRFEASPGSTMTMGSHMVGASAPNKIPSPVGNRESTNRLLAKQDEQVREAERGNQLMEDQNKMLRELIDTVRDAGAGSSTGRPKRRPKNEAAVHKSRLPTTPAGAPLTTGG